MATGVPMDQWVDWGARAMATGYEVLEQWAKQRAGGRRERDDGPQMSG